MVKYAQTKRYYHDYRIEAYMYAFMSVELYKFPEDNYFPANILFNKKYNKKSTLVPVPQKYLF